MLYYWNRGRWNEVHPTSLHTHTRELLVEMSDRLIIYFSELIKESLEASKDVTKEIIPWVEISRVPISDGVIDRWGFSNDQGDSPALNS